MPADGFYEWQGEKGARTPFAIRPRGGGLMAFAGLWQDWRGPEGWISTCAIVTCPANAVLAPIHDRMPVIVAPEDFALWLGEAGPGAARLMAPAPEEALVGGAGRRGDAGDPGTTAGAFGRDAAPAGVSALRAFGFPRWCKSVD